MYSANKQVQSAIKTRYLFRAGNFIAQWFKYIRCTCRRGARVLSTDVAETRRYRGPR